MTDSQALLSAGAPVSRVRAASLASFGTKGWGKTARHRFFLINANVITVIKWHLVLTRKLKSFA